MKRLAFTVSSLFTPLNHIHFHDRIASPPKAVGATGLFPSPPPVPKAPPVLLLRWHLNDHPLYATEKTQSLPLRSAQCLGGRRMNQQINVTKLPRCLDECLKGRRATKLRTCLLFIWRLRDKDSELLGWWTCRGLGRAMPSGRAWERHAFSPFLALCVSSTWLLISQ